MQKEEWVKGLWVVPASQQEAGMARRKAVGGGQEEAGKRGVVCTQDRAAWSVASLVRCNETGHSLSTQYLTASHVIDFHKLAQRC